MQRIIYEIKTNLMNFFFVKLINTNTINAVLSEKKKFIKNCRLN